MTLIQNDNLIFRYSGGAFNDVAANSIGGDMSEFSVISGLANTLFRRALVAETTAGSVKYRWVYFLNLDTNGSGLIDGKVWVWSQPGTGCAYQVGVAAAKNTAQGVLDDEDTAPSGIAFSAPSTYATGIALPTPLSQDDYIGIAIKRTISVGAAYQDAECRLIVSGTTA